MRERLTNWVATLAMVALIPILIIAMAASTLAARPVGATLDVEPNAAAAWGWATASGCGYRTGEVYLDIEKPEALAFMAVNSNDRGCITVTFTTDGPGTYYLSTRQQVKNRWKTMATYTLPVE